MIQRILNYLNQRLGITKLHHKIDRWQTAFENAELAERRFNQWKQKEKLNEKNISRLQARVKALEDKLKEPNLLNQS